MAVTITVILVHFKFQLHIQAICRVFQIKFKEFKALMGTGGEGSHEAEGYGQIMGLLIQWTGTGNPE